MFLHSYSSVMAWMFLARIVCGSLFFALEASIKDVHSQGRRGFAQCKHFADGGGGLQMRTSALFGAETSDFSKLKMCPQGQRRWWLSQCVYFATRGRGQFFAILCGRLLRTAPYCISTRLYYSRS